MTDTSLATGSVIAERFRLERKLGEGGMGEVWAALHLVTKKPVALKFLKSDGKKDAASSRRFLREARAASAVRHPNVVQVHDVLEFGPDEFVIVMDLLHGESLSQLIERKGALSLDETAAVLVPALRALRAAHAAGIVHRDLKPDNLFLDRPSPEEMQPKLLDFGIAKHVNAEGLNEQSLKLTQTGTLMGTPFYMSPEQVYGEKDVDHRSDVWAMGVISYECLCGTKPFQGENFGQLFKAVTRGEYKRLAEAAPHLPEAVVQVVESLLLVDRDKRPGDIEPLLQVLTPYHTGQTLSLTPSGQTRIATRLETDETLVASELSQSNPRPRGAALPWLFGGFGVLATTVGGYWVTTQPEDEPTVDPLATAPQTPATSVPEPPEPATPTISVVPAATASAEPTSNLGGAVLATAPLPPRSLPQRQRENTTKLPERDPTPPRATAPPPDPTRLPGSIVGDAPF